MESSATAAGRPPAREEHTALRRAIGPRLLTVFVVGDILGAGVYASWARSAVFPVIGALGVGRADRRHGVRRPRDLRPRRRPAGGRGRPLARQPPACGHVRGGGGRGYGDLFGWSFEDLPIPDGGFYSMARLDGREAAAIYRMQAEQPPAWLSYVTVEDADARASRARELGATAIQEPFDVMEAGRMAVLQDPTGAVFAVWQPRESIGARIVNGHGALSLNQLNTTDPQRAQDFYNELFGWRAEAVDGGEQPYWGLFIGERLNGGMMQLPPGAGAPPHWLVYFGADDVDAAAERIAELGGTVLVPKTPVPGGEILVAQDPQGAVFGLVAGRFDD